jgi:hypothetical protein
MNGSGDETYRWRSDVLFDIKRGDAIILEAFLRQSYTDGIIIIKV